MAVRRYELSDEAFALVVDLLPRNGRRGGQWHDHRTALNGMFWILHSGAQWRELPERYGPWQTVYARFRRWSREGLWERILQTLQRELDAAGQIEWTLWCIDGSHVRAHKAAAGAGKKSGGARAGRSRAGAQPRRVRHEAPPRH